MSDQWGGVVVNDSVGLSLLNLPAGLKHFA